MAVEKDVLENDPENYSLRAGVVSGLAEWSTACRKPWVPSPTHHTPGTAAHTWNPNTQEVEKGDEKPEVRLSYIMNSKPAYAT